VKSIDFHRKIRLIKSRNKQIEQQGAVKHGHLKDVQMDLHMQKTQELRETMRRR